MLAKAWLSGIDVVHVMLVNGKGLSVSVERNVAVLDALLRRVPTAPVICLRRRNLLEAYGALECTVCVLPLHSRAQCVQCTVFIYV